MSQQGVIFPPTPCLYLRYKITATPHKSELFFHDSEQTDHQQSCKAATAAQALQSLLSLSITEPKHTRGRNRSKNLVEIGIPNALSGLPE